MSSGFTAQQLAGLPGLPSSAFRVRERAEREHWPAVIQPRRGSVRETTLYPVSALPAETQAALVNRAAEAASVPVDLTGVTAARREQVLERTRLVNAVAELVAHGASAEVAIEQVRDVQKVAHSARTIRRWWNACRGVDPVEWPSRLMPAWRGRGGQSECHPQAWAYLYDDWLRQSQPALESCYRRMVTVARSQGWSPIPSLHSIRRRIKREVPQDVVVLRRSGKRALERLYAPQERDRTVFGALEAITADGHTFDVSVLWPDGVVERPTIVGFQDLRTGKILSWRCDRSENTEVIRLAFADCVTEHGVPRIAYLDNGRSWASKQMSGGTKTRYRGKILPEDPTGLFTMLGVEIHWTTPYHGQAKPIERAWRDFCGDIARHPAFEGAYVGSNPTKRPDNWHRDHAVPLADFLSVVSLGIAEHNARPGRAALAGRSFDAVYAELYAVGPIRRVTEEQRRLLYLAMGQVTVRTDATVHVHGARYWAQHLIGQIGRRVTVRFDPERLAAGAYIYAQDGTYVGFAEAQGKVAFNDTHAARAHTRARRAMVKAVSVAAKAEQTFAASELGAMHLHSAAPPAEPLTAKVVSPVFGKLPKLPKDTVTMGPTEGERQARAARDAGVTRIGRAAMSTLEQKADDDLVRELGLASFAKLAGERR